ncbi:MAG: hypothetical protein J1E64_08460 [Acetatifactor sp.]|nr:hypothetical protein [Acetatifactor sp.]
MSVQTEVYMAMAAACGLQYDTFHNVIYGQKNGFDLLIYEVNMDNPNVLNIHTAARRNGSALSQEERAELTRGTQGFTVMDQKRYDISTVLAKSNDSEEELVAALPEAVDSFLSYLTIRGFQPCCSICGQNARFAGYQSGPTCLHLCENCESRISGGFLELSPTMGQNRKENVLLGIMGALIGSLLGVLMIVVLGRLGIVASFSGVMMAIGVLKGYEILGGNLSKRGIVISVAIMLIMAYVGDRLDWALLVYQEYGKWISSMHFSFMECYLDVPRLISNGVIELRRYLLNLTVLYVFLLLGAVPTLRKRTQVKTAQVRVIKIGQ